MGVVAEGIVADSENTSEPKGEGEPVAPRSGNQGCCLRARDLRMKTTKRPGKRCLGSTRGGIWGPTRIGIRRRNRSSILRVCVNTDVDVGSLIEQYWSTGEEIKEPEVDLSNFLARQRLDDVIGPSIPKPTTDPDEDEVDHSLAHLTSVGLHSVQKPIKGRVQTREWDEELENMSREIAAADANRGEKCVHGDHILAEWNPGSELYDPQISNQGFVRAHRSSRQTGPQPDLHGL